MTHLWNSRDKKVYDISKSFQDHDKVWRNYKLSKPFYSYIFENGVRKKIKLTLDGKDDNYTKLFSVFGIEEDSEDSDSEDDFEHDENRLQTINIIDNQQEYELSVFYVYGTKIEFKRY